MKTKLKSKLSMLFLAVAAMLAVPAVVVAAELVSAELEGAPNDVTVEQGKSGESFNIRLSATENLSNDITQQKPASAKVKTSYSVTRAANGSVVVSAGDTFSGEQKFWSDQTRQQNSPVTWSGAPTPYSVPATVSVASDVPVGAYTINLSPANNTVQLFNPINAGNRLEDKTATTLTFRVVAPPPPADTTAPIITPHVQGSLGDNGWYVSNVGLSWSVEDNESAISSKKECDNVSITSDQSETTYTCEAKSAGGTSTESVKIKRDATAPTVLPGDIVDNTWRNSALSQEFTAEDNLSGLNAPLADSSFTLTASAESTNANAFTVVSRKVSDEAGNSTLRSLSAKIDLTGPALNISDPNTSVINVCAGATRPTFAPTDALSGLLAGGALDSWVTPTGAPSLGDVYTYSAEAKDNAGNPSKETRSYASNRYGGAYGGILQPINADGSSNFKLGSTIPVKFKLMCGTQPITNANATLSYQKIGSTSDATVNEASSTAAATDGNKFRYDSVNQQYIFNLSTKSGFSQGKWKLYIDLNDGSTPRTATFDILR